jgi:hypothetical protein
VTQAEGDGRVATAYLPTLQIDGLDEPVLQVLDEADGEPLYTLRLNEPTFRPAVFREGGTYTVRVGDGEQWLETLDGVEPLPSGEEATRVMELGD